MSLSQGCTGSEDPWGLLQHFIGETLFWIQQGPKPALRPARLSFLVSVFLPTLRPPPTLQGPLLTYLRHSDPPPETTLFLICHSRRDARVGGYLTSPSWATGQPYTAAADLVLIVPKLQGLLPPPCPRLLWTVY